MEKCVRCGGSFLTRRKIKLKDAEICGKCYKELGFDNPLISDLYKWEDIKDGREAYRLKQRKKEVKDAVLSSFRMAHYGEERELDCTDEEQEIYDLICENVGRDLQLVRVSSNYVTIKCGEWDLARVKYTDKAKWIWFPVFDKEKIYIESPEEALMLDKINASLDHIDKYS